MCCAVPCVTGVTAHAAPRSLLSFHAALAPEIPPCLLLLAAINSVFTIVLYSIGWVYHDVLIYSAVEHLVWFQGFLLASCTAGNIPVHMYFSWGLIKNYSG